MKLFKNTIFQIITISLVINLVFLGVGKLGGQMLGQGVNTKLFTTNPSTSNQTGAGFNITGYNVASSTIVIVNGQLLVATTTSDGFVANINGAVQMGSGTNALITDSRGYIGVGTTTPQTVLDITGDLRLGNTSTTTCSSVIDGTILYHKIDKHIYLCDGTTWLKLDN